MFFAMILVAPASASVSVSLTWDPLTNASVAGCKIYYGVASHNYSQSVDVGNVNMATIPGLTENVVYYFAATTYDSLGNESDFSNEATYTATNTSSPPPIVYVPPTLNPVSNVTINENSGAQSVNLSGISLGSGSTLTITAVSSNPGLIPNPSVNYTSPNSTGLLTFTPAANAFGSAVITVTANNGQAQSNLVSRTFTVTVNQVFVPPTLNPVSNVAIAENSGAQSVNLSGISLGSGSTLAITAVSSNPGLIPNPSVNYTSPNSTGSLTFKPTTNALGSAVITVTANNGQAQSNLVSRAFTVTVSQVSQVYLPPTLNPVSDITLNENSGPQPVNLSGISLGSGSTLAISASSSNPNVLPNPTVTYTSPNASGSFTLTPAANAYGTTVVTITADNGQAQSNLVSRSFNVTVNQVFVAPTLSAVGDVAIDENSGTQSVNLTGITPGSGQSLAISAVSSNPGLIANPTVNYSSPNATGTLTFKPAADAYGTADITITADNGQSQSNLVSRKFTVLVYQVSPPALDLIPDVTLSYGTKTTQKINLSGIKPGSGHQNAKIAVTAVSSNAKIISNPKIAYRSPNSSGTLTFKPTTGYAGTAIVTVTVNDGGAAHNIRNRTFSVTILPNQPPTLDPISDVTLEYNSKAQKVGLTGISSGDPSTKQKVKITAVSSNPGLIPNPKASNPGKNSTSALTLKPKSKTSGTAVITVTVNDGADSNNTVSRTFTVVCLPEQNVSQSVQTTSATVGTPLTLDGLADRSAAVGDSVQFTANASGLAPLLYQWKLNGVALPGMNSASLSLKNITENDAGNYSVDVYDSNGNSTNATAALAVYPTAAAALSPVASSGGQFNLSIEGVPGYQYVVEASSDLVHWTVVQTNTAPFVFTDENASQFDKRFYRATYQPPSQP